MVYAEQEMLLMKKRSDGLSKYAECDDNGNLYVAGTVSTGTNLNYSVDKQQEGLIAEGYVMFPANTSIDTTRLITVPKPSGVIPRDYMLYVTGSTSTPFNISIRNIVSFSGITGGAQVATATIPGASTIIPSNVAWSSCFTDIGGTLTDESNDWADAGASDVPFPFTAVDNAIYFGNGSQFFSMQYAVGTTTTWVGDGVWEYWNGTSWATLSVSTTYPAGMTKPFSNPVEVYIWGQKTDWEPYDIPGSPVSQYWIRYRITSFTSKVRIPSLNTGIYTLYKTPLSHVFKFTGLFNSGVIQIAISNNELTNANGDTPVFWHLNSL
jgi:hypothetical protein